MLDRFAQWCHLVSGWQRMAVAFLAGAIAALSMPPLNLLPAAFVGFPIIVWLLDGVERKQTIVAHILGPAFRIGWAFGFGYFTLGLHWMSGAFFVEPDLFLWALPLGLFGLPALLAIFWGLATALAHLFWSDFGQRILALAVSIALFEFLRGHLFTGFPWNLPGMMFALSLETMQLGALIGVYGMSFIAVLLALTPAVIWPDLDQPISARFGPLGAAIIVLCGIFAFGFWQIGQSPTTYRDDVNLRLVQPNIPQAEKWKPENAELIFSQLLAMSGEKASPADPGIIAATHVIWPESVFPFFIDEHPDALARIARMLPNGTNLIAGAAREKRNLADLGETTDGIHNAIISINDQGEINATYNKYRLVPFGEFVPFKPILSLLGIREFVTASDSFVHGQRPNAPMNPLGTPPFLPLICYEAIFSGGMGPSIAQAQWMLNLTNDAWFKGTIGPQQHFVHAQMRAIEEGVPLVRVANTGITAIIDPVGRIVARLQSDEAGVLNSKLPERLEQTVFSSYRHNVFYLMIFGSFLLVLLRNRWRRYWENID